MEEQPDMFEETPEKSCFDCNNFFPALIDGPTADVICLRDKEFEPFIDDLLEHQNYDRCLDLVRKKKFDGNREVCPYFEKAEIETFEIDENTEFGRGLVEAVESGTVDHERLAELIFEEQLRSIDHKTSPVDQYLPDLASEHTWKRDAAAETLSGLAQLGNEAAFHHLFSFLKELPAIETIDDVHLRLKIIRSMNRDEHKSSVIPFLLDQLEHTLSNNTTRQWISAILRYFGSVPLEEIREPLEAMMKKGCFSYRLKQRIQELINYHYYEEVDF